MDINIFDCQENLSVPLISEKHVPSWNSDPTCTGMQNAFQFAEESLQDNGCVLVFHSYSLQSRRMFAGLQNVFKKLVMKKEWLAFNQLDLASGITPSQTVSFVHCTMLWSISWAAFSFVLSILFIFADCEVWSHLFCEGSGGEKENSLHIQANCGHDKSKVESSEEGHGDQLYH